MLEKILESSLDWKEFKSVNPKGNQPWIFTRSKIFIGGPDAEALAPLIWPPDVKSGLTGKDPDAGKYWRQKEKGVTENEMVGYDSMDMNLNNLWEVMKDRGAWHAVVYEVTKSQTRLSHWSTTNKKLYKEDRGQDKTSLNIPWCVNLSFAQYRYFT